AGVVEVKDGMHLTVTRDFAQTGGVLKLHDGNITAADDLKTSTAVFSGVNHLLSGAGTSKLTATSWTLNLSADNLEEAVVVLDSASSSVSGSASTPQLILASDAHLAAGVYKLISYDTSSFSWNNLKNAQLSGLCEATSIGTEGSSDVYFIVDGTQYTLVYENATASRTTPATLTWGAASGVWQHGVGRSDQLWTGSVEDTNYYNGDSVVFNKDADVELVGVLTPADVKVSHAQGTVYLGGNGQIAGHTALTKTGKGTLNLATTNAYTGGTVIHDGVVTISKAGALGLGDVTLKGGTLVNNTGAVTSLSPGVITLNGGSLSGNFTTAGSRSWIVCCDTELSGSLTLGGGALTLQNNASMSVTGNLYLDSITLTLTGTYEAGESYTLISAGSVSGDVDDLVVLGVENYYLSTQNGALTLVMKGNEPVIPEPGIPDVGSKTLEWSGDKKAVWQQGAGGWQNAAGVPQSFTNGDAVTIGDGTVTIEGVVAPDSILLNPTKSLTFKTKFDKKTGLWSGAIDGEDITLTIAAG
ncbi:MAG: hypothetical protein II349_00865, partial [Akkermansia sp.]|nr:hypothetical protein [Akkermansia sp.]